MKVQLKWNQDKMDELSHRLEKILFQRQGSGILQQSALCGEGSFEGICRGGGGRWGEVMGEEERVEGGGGGGVR